MNSERQDSSLLRHSENMSKTFRINLVLFTFFNSALFFIIRTSDLSLESTIQDPIIIIGFLSGIVSSAILTIGIVVSTPNYDDGSGAYIAPPTANWLFRLSTFLILVSILSFITGILNAYLVLNLENWDTSVTVSVLSLTIIFVLFAVSLIYLNLKPVIALSRGFSRTIFREYILPKLKELYTVSPYMAHTKLEWLEKDDIFLLKHLLRESEAIRVNELSQYSSKNTEYFLDRLKILDKHGLVDLDNYYHVEITDRGKAFATHQYVDDEEFSYASSLTLKKPVAATLLTVTVLFLIYYL